jgi:hypothetical protein
LKSYFLKNKPKQKEKRKKFLEMRKAHYDEYRRVSALGKSKSKAEEILEETEWK